MPDIENEVAAHIDSKKFVGWESVDINLQLDSFSSVDFTAPFEADNPAFRNTFRPFAFDPFKLRIKHDDQFGRSRNDLVFDGTVVGIHPNDDPAKSTVAVSAYAKPGVMADCTMPGQSVPLEFKKLGLQAIALRLAEPFGVEVQFDASEGTPFPQVKLKVTDKPYEFLSKLARQRNLILSNTPEGKLLCTKSVEPGNPVAKLTGGQSPVGSIKASFDPQQWFAELTGFVAKKKGKRAAKHTERNPFLDAIVRPHSFKLEDVEPGDAPEAVRAKLSRMFSTTASWQVPVSTWRDPQGELWQPNTTIVVEAPNAMIYRPYEFLIRGVALHQDSEREDAVLSVVMPGAFSGEAPETLPWAP